MFAVIFVFVCCMIEKWNCDTCFLVLVHVNCRHVKCTVMCTKGEGFRLSIEELIQAYRVIDSEDVLEETSTIFFYRMLAYYSIPAVTLQVALA